ncbi:MAG: sn-glycerol-3-phosphate ABC transporter ATP-binding protein UgpC [Burkholderiaceae bacterium]|nr:sn-glycerol-3-phosphate ABC transporter ATP-binding protein UgpC [Burkholderiaceae bacterium]
MASVSFKNISKKYSEDVSVIKGVDFTIEDGEFVVFVGPSGCGKSTLLRMVAGLEDITGGEIHIGGELANDVHASQRGIAMVFQSYALYPHMSVRQNMGFALKMAGRPKAEIEERVGKAADILQISHLLDRKPKALSGGQRQRVAIGRAIVRQPKVFLFDEPLSNLDASLRQNMRVELSKLHRELGTTMIYVTHDQVEAMTLADRIVVMHAGKVQQVGSPEQLYDEPVNRFVAGFIGSPRMNFIEGAAAQALGAHALGVRPEHLRLEAAQPRWRGRVRHVEFLGADSYLFADVPGVGELTVRLAGSEHRRGVGEEVGIDALPGRVLRFDAQGMRS